MSKPKAYLLLVFHNHQPVGNFDHVFAQASDDCYMPLLETMERFPSIKFSTHFSGPLLDWLEEHRPELINKIRKLVNSGQMEMLGGGYYEPMLSGIPERDAYGQLVMMKERLTERYGAKPSGMWLTERVWEPSLTNVITGAGYEYTLLDDNHFHRSGRTGELDGYYVTEHSGPPLAIFPISKTLRYAIPFQSPGEAVTTIVRLAEEKGGNGVVLTYGDDGEKFGIWPGTKDLVWNKKWLERFLEVLSERSDEVVCAHPSEILDMMPPKGRVYLPTASYPEMEEWVLTPDSHRTYTALRDSLEFAKKVTQLIGVNEDYLSYALSVTELVKDLPSDWVDSYLAFMRKGGRRALSFIRGRVESLISGSSRGNSIGKAALLLISVLERLEPLLEKSPNILESLKNLHSTLHDAKKLAQERSQLELAASFIQGGIWQGFFRKYHESNMMHKRMTHVSARLEALTSSPQGIDMALLDRARNHLYQAQCNCAYWHGIFGGLYMPHLRHAIFEHLDRADVYMDRYEEGVSDTALITDFDGDMNDEVVLSGPELFAVIKPDMGGGLLELDIKGRYFNVTNVLTRRYEWYHDDLMPDGDRNTPEHSSDSGEVKSIHDMAMKISTEDARRVVYDFGPRFSFQDLVMNPEDAAPERLTTFAGRKFSPIGDFAFAPYEVVSAQGAKVALRRRSKVKGVDLEILKTYSLERRVLQVTYELSLPYGGRLDIAFVPESAFTLLAGNVENRRLLRNGASPEGREGNPNNTAYMKAVSSLGLSSRWDGFAFNLSWDRTTGAFVYPLETLSHDESGAVFTYQGTVFAPVFQLHLSEKLKERIGMRIEVELFPAER